MRPEGHDVKMDKRAEQEGEVFECLVCGERFDETDQTNQEHRNGQCPACGYEDIRRISPLEVDALVIDLEILADAVFCRDGWAMKKARQKVVDAVSSALTPEDKQRLEAYQRQNDPCIEQYRRAS